MLKEQGRVYAMSTRNNVLIAQLHEIRRMWMRKEKFELPCDTNRKLPVEKDGAKLWEKLKYLTFKKKKKKLAIVNEVCDANCEPGGGCSGNKVAFSPISEGEVKVVHLIQFRN